MIYKSYKESIDNQSNMYYSISSFIRFIFINRNNLDSFEANTYLTWFITQSFIKDNIFNYSYEVIEESIILKMKHIIDHKGLNSRLIIWRLLKIGGAYSGNPYESGAISYEELILCKRFGIDIFTLRKDKSKYKSTKKEKQSSSSTTIGTIK